MENPLIDFETNAKGTLCVLEKARKDDAKLVFASSAAVYGNPTVSFPLRRIRLPPLLLLRLIQSSRRRVLQIYREQYGLDIVITRFANVYGLRCHGVIHDFLEKLAKNPNKLVIIGTGQQCSRFRACFRCCGSLLVKVGSLKSANGQSLQLGLGKTNKNY